MHLHLEIPSPAAIAAQPGRAVTVELAHRSLLKRPGAPGASRQCAHAAQAFQWIRLSGSVQVTATTRPTAYAGWAARWRSATSSAISPMIRLISKSFGV